MVSRRPNSSGQVTERQLANLRPPNPNPSKETGGRKSNKRTKAPAAELKTEGLLGNDDEMLLDPQEEDIAGKAPAAEGVLEYSPMDTAGLFGGQDATPSMNHQEEPSPQELQGQGSSAVRRPSHKRKKAAATPKEEYAGQSNGSGFASPNKKARGQSTRRSQG